MVQGLDEVGPKNFFLGSVKRVLHVMSSHMFAPQWPQFDGTSSFPKSPLRAKARSSAKSVAPGWLDRPLVTQCKQKANVAKEPKKSKQKLSKLGAKTVLCITWFTK